MLMDPSSFGPRRFQCLIGSVRLSRFFLRRFLDALFRPSRRARRASRLEMSSLHAWWHGQPLDCLSGLFALLSRSAHAPDNGNDDEHKTPVARQGQPSDTTPSVTTIFSTASGRRKRQLTFIT